MTDHKPGPHVARLVHPEPWDEPEAQKRREAGYDWPPSYDGDDDHPWGSVTFWMWMAGGMAGIVLAALVGWGLAAWMG